MKPINLLIANWIISSVNLLILGAIFNGEGMYFGSLSLFFMWLGTTMSIFGVWLDQFGNTINNLADGEEGN